MDAGEKPLVKSSVSGGLVRAERMAGSRGGRTEHFSAVHHFGVTLECVSAVPGCKLEVNEVGSVR